MTKFVLITLFFFALSFAEASYSEQQLCSNSKHSTFKKDDLATLRILKVSEAIPPTDDSQPENFIISLQDESSPFSFHVNRFRSSTKPSKGTVVIACGGPAPCMEQRFDAPTDYDIVMYDFIGTGKNKNSSRDPEAMSVNGQAKVMAKIVEGLKIENYIIYGGSFGTSVATVAAEIIEKDKKLPKPKSVILEGVVGTRSPLVTNAYLRASEVAWSYLTQDEKIAFKKNYTDTVVQLNSNLKWRLDYVLSARLWWGPKVAAERMKDYVEFDKWKELVKNISAASPTEQDPIDLAAGCEVLHKDEVGPDKLFGGLISNAIRPEDDPCRCRQINRNFDSKNHQIQRTPIVYISGELDPATPIEQALYHFQNQQTSQKRFLRVRYGGHFARSVELADCIGSIYEIAFQGSLATLKSDPNSYFSCSGKVPNSFMPTKATK